MRAGSVLTVATLPVERGSRVELRDVLLVSDGDKVTVGNPTVDDALVVAEVVEHGKAKKVTSFKYKAKVRYRRKRGHRQGFTRLAVREIRHGSAVEKAPERRTAVIEAPAEAAAPPARRRRGAAVEEQPAVETAIAEAPPAETEAPAPRRRARAQPKAAEPAPEPAAAGTPPRRRRTPTRKPKE